MNDDDVRARYVEVGPEDADQRIDNFLLRHLKGVPRSHVYRLLRTGQVRVNRGRIKAGYRVRAGDSVRLPPVRLPQTSAPPRPGASLVRLLEASILYEDSHLLVIDKPPGVAVHGGSGVSLGVIEALRAMRPDAPLLELVHRLDRETSGCLVVAKRRSALRALHAALREGRVEKHYLALLAGSWRGGAREMRAKLRKNVLRGGERMVDVSADGKESVSMFVPVRVFGNATLVDVTIRTGRTHQIRVHAAHAGHPVLGDEKYGDRAANKMVRAAGLKRMFLHAARLRFAHPSTDEPLDIEAPLERTLREMLARLEAAAEHDAMPLPSNAGQSG